MMLDNYLMLLYLLLIIPLGGILMLSSSMSDDVRRYWHEIKIISFYYKFIAIAMSLINLAISLVILTFYDNSSNQYQYVGGNNAGDFELNVYDIYLGLDGMSIYFLLLITIITPIGLLANWNSIEDVKSYLIIMLLLEILLLACFLVLDILMFYIFFESILPPLFIFIGLFGSLNKVRASFYLFLYTLLGSLFLLLSILTISTIMGSTDYDVLFKGSFDYCSEIYIFTGIFIAIAVKTPVYGVNIWLLKAHTEAPLGGSIILAAIVLKLGLYGIMRLILPIIPQASLNLTFIVYSIAVITIIYSSISTLRTTDIKELIAYSSVAHASVYLAGVFSNTVAGIEGSVLLGLAHGFASSGLFIVAGGVLYDRSGTRAIQRYKGITQNMPLLSLFFFILCLANCGAPLTLNFVGEFMSLYGTFERLPLIGAIASSSIVLSGAYTIYLYNRVAFGVFSNCFQDNFTDVTKREFLMLFILVLFLVGLGVYPSVILDGIHYSISTLIYSSSSSSKVYAGEAGAPLSLAFTNYIIIKGGGFVSMVKRVRFALGAFLEWTVGKARAIGLTSPPRPYSFTTLPVQSKFSLIESLFKFLSIIIKKGKTF